MPRNDESDEEQFRRQNLTDWRIKQLEKLIKSYEDRIRVLEDYKLEVKITHRNMVKWITIASTAFAAAVSLLEHILFHI